MLVRGTDNLSGTAGAPSPTNTADSSGGPATPSGSRFLRPPEREERATNSLHASQRHALARRLQILFAPVDAIVRSSHSRLWKAYLELPPGCSLMLTTHGASAYVLINLAPGILGRQGLLN